MLDITAFCNALQQGKVSFVASLGVGPYIDTDGAVVAITGDDAVVFPLGTASGGPRYALRLPLEHGSGGIWPRRYADIAGATGAITAFLPDEITILDVDDVPGTGVALLYDWVPGETLTHRVTRARQRHDRDSLAELLRPLADLADALRVSGVVHGDISPGNVIVRPDGGVAIIDLDRVGVKGEDSGLEPRRRAGYRIPRGGGAPAEEDAFALLVIMTSCAILADSSAPIDHEHAAEASHPTLLFSSWDLMDLQRSRLVRDVDQQLTPISRGLLELLTTASSGPPSRIPSVLRDAVRRIRHHAPEPQLDPRIEAEPAHGWQPVLASPAAAQRPRITSARAWESPTETLSVSSNDTSWPEPQPAIAEPRDTVDAVDWSLPRIDDILQRLRTLPSVEGRSAGVRRRSERTERRRHTVSEELHRALRENDRAVLVHLAMSGALAELGDSDRTELLQVIRALAHDSIARAIATDDDGLIVAAVDESVFQRETDLDPAFRDRVRAARDRMRWADQLHDAVRVKDARACQLLVNEAPEDGVERVPEATRQQAVRLAEQRAAEVAASDALRRRDADGLARALGQLTCVRPTWTDVVDAGAVVELLSEEQIEERLVRELQGGGLSDEHQWMADIVIAAGRLPEVTRMAGLTPRDVDAMIHKPISRDTKRAGS